MSIVDAQDARDALNLDDNDTLLPIIQPLIEAACCRYVGWEGAGIAAADKGKLPLERATYTNYYPRTERGGGHMFWPGEFGSYGSIGGRSDIIVLRHKYVLATGLVVEEFAGAYMGQADETDWETLTLGDEYMLDLDDDNVSRSGHVRRLGADWPKARGSVKVTYTAGFTATELSGQMTGSADYTDASDVRYAVLLAIMAAYNEAKTQQQNNAMGRTPGSIIAESIEGYSYRLDTASTAALLGMTTQLPPKAQQILHRYSNRYAIAI